MKEMNNCSYAYAVGKLEERWRTLLEEEIDNCVPMTFMVCTAVAGMVSEFRGEESVKVILSERSYRGKFGSQCNAIIRKNRGMYIMQKV